MRGNGIKMCAKLISILEIITIKFNYACPRNHANKKPKISPSELLRWGQFLHFLLKMHFPINLSQIVKRTSCTLLHSKINGQTVGLFPRWSLSPPSANHTAQSEPPLKVNCCVCWLAEPMMMKKLTFNLVVLSRIMKTPKTKSTQKKEQKSSKFVGR